MAEIEKPDTPTNVVDNIYDDAIEIFDTSELLKNGKLEHADLAEKLMKKGYTFKEVETFLNDTYMKQAKDNPKGFENISKEEFIKYADTPTNLVDDKLSTFDTTLNSADGNVEFYIKHQGTQVSANDIRYNPNLGSDTEKFIPGFYGEPVGNVSAETMGIKIQDNPVSNYYKVQVNTNNLLITQPDGFLGNQIDKVDWDIFAKETGISLSDIKNPKTQNVNSLINELKQLGLDDGTIAEGFRKSGIEGFVELKGDWREVVLIDPNDDLGIGNKLNIEDATEVDFINNQSKVNQLDELVITPKTVVDDAVQPSLIDDAIEYVDNLNIDNKVKKEITEKIAKVGGKAAGQIPIPGVGQAIDFWETAVLVVGASLLAAGEVDELPKVVQNFGIDLYNGFLSSLNIPFTPVEKVEYTPNTDRIIKGLDIIDKLQPTSYAINPVIKEFQEIEATTPTMELPGFGTVPASQYYQPPVESTPERDNINSIMTNLMQNISNAQGAYPITASELSNFQRNPIQVVPSNSADKPEKVEYDSKEKQNLHDIYANMFTSLSESMIR